MLKPLGESITTPVCIKYWEENSTFIIMKLIAENLGIPEVLKLKKKKKKKETHHTLMHQSSKGC